jgi:hypothetical protein
MGTRAPLRQRLTPGDEVFSSSVPRPSRDFKREGGQSDGLHETMAAEAVDSSTSPDALASQLAAQVLSVGVMLGLIFGGCCSNVGRKTRGPSVFRFAWY